MKICSKCRIEKELSDFGLDNRMRLGRRSACRECNAKFKREQYSKNREQILIDVKKYQAKYPEVGLNATLKRSYGIMSKDWDRMFNTQEDMCARCHKLMDRNKRREIHVDHNHLTGQVRALIHRRCNLLISGVDDKDELKLSLEYLKKYDREWAMEVK